MVAERRTQGPKNSSSQIAYPKTHISKDQSVAGDSTAAASRRLTGSGIGYQASQLGIRRSGPRSSTLNTRNSTLKARTPGRDARGSLLTVRTSRLEGRSATLEHRNSRLEARYFDLQAHIAKLSILLFDLRTRISRLEAQAQRQQLQLEFSQPRRPHTTFATSSGHSARSNCYSSNFFRKPEVVSWSNRKLLN